MLVVAPIMVRRNSRTTHLVVPVAILAHLSMMPATMHLVLLRRRPRFRWAAFPCRVCVHPLCNYFGAPTFAAVTIITDANYAQLLVNSPLGICGWDACCHEKCTCVRLQ